MAEPGRTSCVDLSPTVTNSILFLLAFDFCQFCVVIRFFIPATTANDLRLWRIFYPRFYPLHFFSYLNSSERAPVFPFLMLSAKQGNNWYHFDNVFGMMQSLTGDWTRDLPHSCYKKNLKAQIAKLHLNVKHFTKIKSYYSKY